MVHVTNTALIQPLASDDEAASVERMRAAIADDINSPGRHTLRRRNPSYRNFELPSAVDVGTVPWLPLC